MSTIAFDSFAIFIDHYNVYGRHIKKILLSTVSAHKWSMIKVWVHVGIAASNSND